MADEINVPTSKKLILVAEDDRYYGNIFKAKLIKEGYDVVLAVDGRQTVELVKEKHPSLVLLDLIMPVMDGFEALRILKEDPTTADIPVVVVSNLGQDEDIQRASKLGAKEFIIKANLSIQELMAKIHSFVA